MTVLVHDYLLVQRGAERTFAVMCDMFPGAPVATLLHDRKVFRGRLEGHDIRTSFVQSLGLRQRTFKPLMPLLPRAVEALDVSGHDLVVSSSSAFAHGVRPDPGATHVCYCHTPFRYAWHARDEGIRQAPAWARPAVGRALSRVRRWDREVAQRDTHYVANGPLTQRRMADVWGVHAPIVYPPVELSRFAPSVVEDYVLLVGELVLHKRWEVALEACRRAKVPVKVVGWGTDARRLIARFSDSAEFLGHVGDDELALLYARARCLLMPNTEEFGITAVEAQASGRPVIAVDAGGAQQTITDGCTGILLPDGDEDALVETLLGSAIDRMRPEDATANARRFSVEFFRAGLQEQIDLAMGTHALRAA